MGTSYQRGWKVLPLFRNIHHSPENFPNPEKFDPSRFEVAPKQNTYLPFGNGTHACPGNELAKLEMLVLLHHLTTQYRWSLAGFRNGIQFRACDPADKARRQSWTWPKKAITSWRGKSARKLLLPHVTRREYWRRSWERRAVDSGWIGDGAAEGSGVEDASQRRSSDPNGASGRASGLCISEWRAGSHAARGCGSKPKEMTANVGRGRGSPAVVRGEK
ncbi:hypothetical protein HPP92_014672 [Vanilla planifolia]|uniref:Uncharacterized protein n=1 Tax=Vanilla planifolia TaxID=51239 RepID=A0A835UX42_VANPL|nr:hypothetical protein HPP92_014672 [Vanilla planifolia]